MTVRAKFVCISKEHDSESPDKGNVTLQTVTSGSPENEQFFNMTPYGVLNFGILNPEAFAQFEPGQNYYVDFSPATPEANGQNPAT